MEDTGTTINKIHLLLRLPDPRRNSVSLCPETELTNIPEMGAWDEPTEDCPMSSICLAHHTTYNEDDMEDPYEDDEEVTTHPQL